MKPTLFVLLGALALVGCSSSQVAPPVAATVEGTTITDPKMGLRGLVITLPERYTRHTPAPKGSPSNHNGQWAWSMGTDYDKYAGNAALEHIAYAHEDLGITISLIQTNQFIDEGTFKFNERRIAELMTKSVQFPSGTDVTRETKPIGGRQVSCVGRTLPAPYYRYNAVYEFFVPPSRKVVINGVSSIRQKDLLIGDIEATIASVRPAKP